MSGLTGQIPSDCEAATISNNSSSNTSAFSTFSSEASFAGLTDELLLQVAEYLPARDLLRFQCVSKEVSRLDTNSIWKKRCEERWQAWPRYRLTVEREEELNETLYPDKSWKQRYIVIEEEATRTELRYSDLHELSWHLSFVLSPPRGLSEGSPICFLPGEYQYVLFGENAPLPYEIINHRPPFSSAHIRDDLRGDCPFSERQYLRIYDFPVHFITRRQSDAEWQIVNENVVIVSRKNG